MTAKEKIAVRTEKRNKVVAELQKKQKDDETKQLTELEREELSKQQECTLIMDSFGVSDSAPVQMAELDFSKVSTKQDFIDLSSKLVEKFKKLEVVFFLDIILRLLPTTRTSLRVSFGRFHFKVISYPTKLYLQWTWTI